MQHATMYLRRLRHTLDLARVAFLANQFGGKVSLIFGIIYQIAHLHN